MSLLAKLIQYENYRLLEQLETRRMIARKKSWNKKAVFTKTSIVPTSEIHFWIYTMLKHLISGHIKRNTDVFMSIELPVSIWKWIHGFVRKNWALLWCTPHPTHALARFNVYNQQPPPPVELISPCFFRSRNYPSTSCSQPLSVSFHSQAQHSALREHKV